MEVWKQVSGFENYEVSNLGNVMSWNVRNKRSSTPSIPKILKPTLSGGANNNYLTVRLYKNTKPVSKKVHHLVMDAFVGPMPEGMECRRHTDGDYFNNDVTNLAYGTHSQNSLEREEHKRQRLRTYT